ncbi:hypothetical protein NUM_68640 [Actinocatenispora comari]|uniref:Uncharacterized protein n=1 Tax=Actinocatenispora comari TaxID=2807577 RepID=A0A8J4ALF6_9ACTN|nr:hypothetical protein NUM_68640 [Actinocatenispora comari]
MAALYTRSQASISASDAVAGSHSLIRTTPAYPMGESVRECVRRVILPSSKIIIRTYYAKDALRCRITAARIR